MKRFFTLATAVCLAASCSSMKVVSKVSSDDYEPVDAQDVLVCEKGVGVPDTAVKIGEFSAYDDGSAKTEPYEATLNRVKEDAGSKGANVINILEHEEPSIRGSSNHQLSGDYLFAKDFTSSDVNSFTQAYSAYEEAKAEAAAQRFTGGSLRAGAGIAVMPTKLDFTESSLKLDPSRLHFGLAYEVSYDYYTKSGFSFGFVGTCYQVWSPAELEGYHGTFSMGVGVWGPTIGYCASTSKLLARAVFGAGYGSYTESFKMGSGKTGGNSGGMGISFATELLYRINNSTSIGVSLEDNAIGFNNSDVQGTLEWYTIALSLRRSF